MNGPALTGFNNVCVFCGSSDGDDPKYLEGAVALGKELLKRKIGLVYGGGTVGLMGAVAKTIQSGGGKLVGIIPNALVAREVSGDPLGDIIKVDSMHTRKAKMMTMSDAFIALPGGYGTLEAVLESVTWVQLGVHCKPIGLLNINNFFGPLLDMIKQATERGFIRPSAANLLVVSDDPAALLDRLNATVPPQGLRKWLTENQL